MTNNKLEQENIRYYLVGLAFPAGYSMSWTVDPDPIDKSDVYEWHLPLTDQQHVKDTVAPGDLLIKPKDITLKPTKAPERSGVQHGQDTWNFDATPIASGWYIFNTVIDD